MISFILAASLIVSLATAAPLAPRAPTSISFRGPESDVSTCSAPVTLSWSIEDDQNTTGPETVAPARVVVSSVDGDFTHTIDGVVRRTSIVWDTVDVPPGKYTVTGVLEDTNVDIEVNASPPFTVVSGESLDCISSSTSSTKSSTAGQPTSGSASATSSTTTTTPTVLAESQTPSSTTTATPQAKTESVQPALVAAIVASLLIVSIAVFSALYYRANRAKEHANIEYPLPKMNGKDTESLHEGRRSSDTVVEVKARAPTPVSILSRTTTKHGASLSEVDLVKRQELLRAMGRG